jgi:hypothetical protein
MKFLMGIFRHSIKMLAKSTISNEQFMIITSWLNSLLIFA